MIYRRVHSFDAVVNSSIITLLSRKKYIHRFHRNIYESCELRTNAVASRTATTWYIKKEHVTNCVLFASYERRKKIATTGIRFFRPERRRSRRKRFITLLGEVVGVFSSCIACTPTYVRRASVVYSKKNSGGQNKIISRYDIMIKKFKRDNSFYGFSNIRLSEMVRVPKTVCLDGN